MFVHEPQPAVFLPLHGKKDARCVWRCHIDTGQPNPSIWGFCRQFLTDYDTAIFTMDEFVPPDCPVGVSTLFRLRSTLEPQKPAPKR